MRVNREVFEPLGMSFITETDVKLCHHIAQLVVWWIDNNPRPLLGQWKGRLFQRRKQVR